MKMALLFRHDTGWNFRRVIARVTGAPVHVALLFGDDVVIEADGAYVRQLTRADRVRVGQWSTVRCDITDEQAEQAYRFASSQFGKRYDWLGVLWAWWFGAPAGNGARDKWFCSELAAASLVAAGVAMGTTRAAYFTPRRLWEWCASWR